VVKEGVKNMKRILLTFAAVSALGLVGCGEGSSDQLMPGAGSAYSNNPNQTSGGSEESTFNHSNDPAGASEGPLPDPGQRAMETAAAGGAVASARMHACGKLSLRAMRNLMVTRGASANSQGLVTNAANASALGAPNYAGRIPEAAFASTSALGKAFDIYVTASADMVNPTWAPTACPGVKLTENGKFTKDAVSCIIGKPAKAEHMALADDLVAQAATPADGQRIAVAALLAAAHTCE
jgi:hypothetical protein